MKAKIKRFFESTGFTKSQLITVVLCYFLCFALFLGVVVIWDPMSKSTSEQTIAVDDTTPTGPTNTDGWWITEGRYSIEWFKNAQSVEIDGTTYQPGTEQNPYKIDSAEDLAGLSYLVYTKGQADNPLVSGTDYSGNYIFQDKFFKQTANIDLSAYYWQPIGIKYTRDGTSRSNYFSGNYDGGNHTVSGIFTPARSSIAYFYQGLFGYVASSSSSYPVTIQNIGITNSFIQGTDSVGGVVGEAGLNTTITNCYNTGSVESSNNYVGGVVGYASASSGATITITNCYNTGKVTGSGNCVGGVVGYASASSGTTITITNCYNTGKVTGSGNNVGGVVGYASGTITITNCYNTGSVSGSSSVGGVVGYAYAYPGTITITNCYNTGAVSGSSRVGGVVGYASGTITISNCYNTGTVTSTATNYSYVGGVVGDASGTTTITNCYNTGDVSGSSYVGGVVGWAYGTITITNCYNTGDVSGSSYVGGVVGDASGTTTITNCYNTGSVTSTATGYTRVGGVVGNADVSSGSLTITNCYNTGKVTGSGNCVGGVVGYASASSGTTITITNCYNTGDISGSGNCVGGVVGYANAYSGTTITITNCYNTGLVTGETEVGGVVGDANASSGSLTITNCYNTGNVTSTATGYTRVGGVVGYASSATITSCYYGENCLETVGGINGADVPGQAEFDSNIATNAKTLLWYTSESWNSTRPWDFEDVWVLDSGRNDGYPSFIITYWISDPSYYSIEWFKNAQSVEIDGTTYQPGTEQNPYIIDSAEDLAGLSYLVYTKGEADNPLVSGTHYSGKYIFQDKYFKQTANIDLSAYYWQPIGIGFTRDGTSRQNYFSGNYDGGNHTVSGIFTPAGSSSAYSNQGLFGSVGSSSSSYPVTIQNIGITNSFIQGYQNVGGVVGFASASSGTITITNCYNRGTVTSTATSYSYVGGVVGWAYASSGTITITNCYNTGDVSGSRYYVGGVVGSASNATITNCYNTGSVSGSSDVGGVVGSASASSSGAITMTITNCYNTGSVSGSSDVGGVVGHAGSNTTITNCYNTGDVSGSSSVGGVVGSAFISSDSATITITNCYNTGAVTCTATGRSYVGGVVGEAGLNTTITNCYYGENCLETVGGINGYDKAGQAEFDPNIATNAKTLLWYTTPSNWNSSHRWNFEKVWVLDSSVNDGYPSFIVPVDWWINEGYYSIEWFNNADTETYGDGSETNPYIIDSAEDLAGLSWLVYTRGQEENPLVEGTDYSINGSTFSVFENKHFIQSENIDLSAHVWQPIGIRYTREGTTRQNYFSGNYDGQGFTVSGISTPEGQTNAYSNQGLFGYCDLSDMNQSYEIKNVNIVNSNIKGYDHVGGVVGRCGNADLYLINCSNFGSVSGNKWVGGIIGNSSRPILNCYNGGEIFGNTYVGGISGDASQIYKCYNIGKATGTASVGGVIGCGTAKYCYNQGEVSGTTYVGGIVGGFVNSSSFASRCYNTGTITGNDYVAGIVGYSYSSDGTYDASDVIAYNINIGQIQGVTNVGQIASACERTELIKNYFNTGSSADTVDGATYDSNAENYLHDEAWLYENLFWDIGFTYKISQDAYPTFRTEEEKNSWLNESLVEINTNWEGLGTIDEPYKISSAEDLAGLAVAVNTGMIGNEALEYSNVQTPLGIQAQVYFQGIYFEQTADIDLSSHYWESIGQVDANLEKLIAFGGNYNGNNYKISGLKTVENIYTYQINSLFSSIIGTSTQKAEIKNINFDKTNFVASPTMFNGILAGMSFDAQINNCKFEGNIFIPHEYAEPYIFGGVVGSYAVDSIITDCINYCDIYSEFSADAICGIVGMLASFSTEGVAKIENCVNYGNFSGAGDMYGICYAVMMGEISGCKNYGNMTSSDIKMSPDRSDEIVCGIVGTVENGQIKNCENYGKLTSYSIVDDKLILIAGIAYSISSSSLTNCNNYGTISTGNIDEGTLVAPSGVVGSMTDSTIDNCNNYGTVEGGMYGAGIVMSISGETVVKGCENFGLVSGMIASGGIVGMIADVANVKIVDCGCFGKLKSSLNVAGILAMYDNRITVDAVVENCIVDATIEDVSSDVCVGGIFGCISQTSGGVDHVVLSADKCLVNINILSDGTYTATDRLFDGEYRFGHEGDTYTLTYTNSYSKILVDGIVEVKGTTDDLSEMEGNFVYLDGFYDDMPVPIKTDGTNFFHMHDFGSKTGILNQLEKLKIAPYNMVEEPITIDSIYLDPNSSPDAPVLIEPEVDYLPYELDLTVDKEYVITFYVEGKKIVYKTTAMEISNGKAGLAIAVDSGDTIYIDSSGNSIVGYILSGYKLTIDMTGEEIIEYPGKTWISFCVYGEEESTPTILKQVELVSIREFTATNLLDEPIVFQTRDDIDIDTAPDSDFETILDRNFNLQLGATYKVSFNVIDETTGEVTECSYTTQATEKTFTDSTGSYIELAPQNESDFVVGYMVLLAVLDNAKFVLNENGVDCNRVLAPGESSIESYVAKFDEATGNPIFFARTIEITGITLIA